MPNLALLSIICTALQIIGLIMIICWNKLPSYTGAFISVCGFAAIVQIFLPLPNHQGMLEWTAAICGIGGIIIGAIRANGSKK